MESRARRLTHLSTLRLMRSYLDLLEEEELGVCSLPQESSLLLVEWRICLLAVPRPLKVPPARGLLPPNKSISGFISRLALVPLKAVWRKLNYIYLNRMFSVEKFRFFSKFRHIMAINTNQDCSFRVAKCDL